MRITGGTLCGRRLRVPGVGVRPTQDKVRQALFSILGATVDGSRFLDLFAGSGGVGLEAWSRGAENVVWVERDRKVFNVLEYNVQTLCGDGNAVICSDVKRFLKNTVLSTNFDIIFADPPYGVKKEGRASVQSGGGNKKETEKRGWLPSLLTMLYGSNLLAESGVFVMEMGGGDELFADDGWKITADKRYGDTRLCFFMRS